MQDLCRCCSLGAVLAYVWKPQQEQDKWLERQAVVKMFKHIPYIQTWGAAGAIAAPLAIQMKESFKQHKCEALLKGFRAGVMVSLRCISCSVRIWLLGRFRLQIMSHNHKVHASRCCTKVFVAWPIA